jgi:hypothetical protein
VVVVLAHSDDGDAGRVRRLGRLTASSTSASPNCTP